MLAFWHAGSGQGPGAGVVHDRLALSWPSLALSFGPRGAMADLASLIELVGDAEPAAEDGLDAVLALVGKAPKDGYKQRGSAAAASHARFMRACRAMGRKRPGASTWVQAPRPL